MDDRMNVPEDERIRILRMVEEGKISASEGVSLLDALGRKSRRVAGVSTGPGSIAAQDSGSAGGPRWFRVRVTHADSGRSKASINIPLSLMDWGLRIGAQFAPEVGQVDLRELNRILDQDGVGGKIIDVLDEDDNEHVEIFVE